MSDLRERNFPTLSFLFFHSLLVNGRHFYEMALKCHLHTIHCKDMHRRTVATYHRYVTISNQYGKKENTHGEDNVKSRLHTLYKVVMRPVRAVLTIDGVPF